MRGVIMSFNMGDIRKDDKFSNEEFQAWGKDLWPRLCELDMIVLCFQEYDTNSSVADDFAKYLNQEKCDPKWLHLSKQYDGMYISKDKGVQCDMVFEKKCADENTTFPAESLKYNLLTAVYVRENLQIKSVLMDTYYHGKNAVTQEAWSRLAKNKLSLKTVMTIDGKKLTIINSHLPMDTSDHKPTDANTIGVKKRQEIMSQIISDLNQKNDDNVLWTGDFNFRTFEGGEQLDAVITNFDKFTENKRHFSPTCKIEKKTATRACRRNAANSNAVKDECLVMYDKKRMPSFCDRVLHRGAVKVEKYSAFFPETNGKTSVMEKSDHNPVYAEFTL